MSSALTLPLSYPFAAVVGCEAAKRALLLLAVDRGLKGAIICSAPGSAKSTLARSFQSLLSFQYPDREGGDTASPFVELPLNATEDRLLGGLDLERTLATGRRHPLPGLLARAHGGLLYVDDINLIEAGLACHIASALDAGRVRIEREGISETRPAEFSLIGTYNAEEGEVSALLGERVGLLVDAAPAMQVEDRAEIMRRTALFQEDPAAFIEEYAIETASLRSAIVEARALLPCVRVTTEDIEKLSLSALSLGVKGNRADIFAVRAARANAALDGRRNINDDDIITAIELVLLPRATSLPMSEESLKEQNDSPPPGEERESKGEADESPADRKADELGAIEDLIVKAIDARVPDDLLSKPEMNMRRAISGRSARASANSSGRYVRSTAHRTGAAKIAIDATLRAAAPFQLSRKKRESTAEGQTTTSKRVKLMKGDLRYKKFKRRSGMLFIFVVDASGSMALNRMAQAKGALTRLLEEAYLHRDRVALVSFRGEGAEVLLPPTRSVELARRLIDALPAGGATPVAAGLVRAIELARLARAQHIRHSMLVLFTDGRANVGLHTGSITERNARASAIKDELRQIGAILESESIASVVIDTRSKFVSGGDGRALAEMIGGRYVYLPRAEAEAIYKAVTSAAEDVRGGGE
ncbi:MAG: magnesium chelatase ATPase subunit D [Blastocatellia bacterium]|nr:magnesium chelatase ATPase subunit D [Blastocatellia bacterium]